MNDPKKHHYVPQVYLQRFAMNKSGDLMALEVKSKYPKKVRPKKINKSQVCYTLNGYRYETNYSKNLAGTQDNNVIEKESFGYENNRLTFLFDEIDHSNKLTRSQTEELIKILINLKKRNPSFGNMYVTYKDYDGLVKEVVGNFKYPPKLANLPDELKQNTLNRVEKFFSKIFKHDAYRKDLYRSTLHGIDPKIEEDNKEFILRLLDWKITIFRTDADNPFITSDNPGYTYKSPFLISNTNFGYIDFFVFPLSPTSLIHFSKSNPSRQNRLLVQTPITFRKAKINEVLKYNTGTVFNSSQYVFSASTNQLSIVYENSKNDGLLE